MSAQLDRLPPQAIEAEQSLLGVLMLGGEVAWDAIASIVVESDFYRDDHRRIFRTISQLQGAQKPVDVVTVADALAMSNEADQTGGLAYLAEMANSVVSTANIRGYAGIVVDRSRRRRLIATAEEISSLAYGLGSAQVAIDQAGGLLMQLQESSTRSSEPKHISDVLHRTMQGIEGRIGQGEIFGLSTGLDDLDKLTAGMHAGDLIIIAGRPSMGKSAVAINIAEQASIAGKTTLVFSLEMSDEQLALRNLASIGHVPMQTVRSGAMNHDEWDQVTAAMGRLFESKMWIKDMPNMSVVQMHADARRLKRKSGLDLIVIDYLQLMDGDGNIENQAQKIGDMTRRLKVMARSLGVPVILLSQLSRKVEERTDKRPMMSDLRESGAIEQDADVILMVYREEYYKPETEWKGMAEINVVKNRMGATGSVKAIFQGEYSKFLNADPATIAQVMSRIESKPAGTKRRGMDGGF